MKRYIRPSLTLFLLVVFAGCQPELPAIYAPESATVGSLEQEFEVFWNGMNNNYIFWDVDPTDWDAVHGQYKPLFAQLKDEEDIEKARTYYTAMTAKLIDSHYAILFNDGTNISPASNRVKQRPTYHDPLRNEHFNTIVQKKYLAENSLSGTGIDSEGDTHFFVAGKLKNTNILYFHFSGFALSDIYQKKDESAAAVIQYVLDELRNPNLDGVIIDVRSNGGGQARDLDFLVGCLTDKPYVYGALRSKSGMGRLDYLPWTPASVNPPAGSKAFTKPVIALADMHSVSMAEITSMAIKALPGGNGRIVGERTWGGQGPISENKVYNGGQFTISRSPNIKLVYTSSNMLRYKDGRIYEGLGFPPDVEAPYNAAALKVGKDTQLEKAIAQIQ